MEIKKTSDIKPDKVKILLYGEAGTGKTTFASTAPRPIFFDFDNGLLSVRNKEGVSYVDYRDLELKDIWSTFMEDVEEVGKGDEFDTVIIDSLSTISDTCMDHILQQSRRLGKPPQQNDWMPQMIELKKMLKLLVAMPKHVIVIGHEQIIKDELTGRIWVLPLITGKMSKQIGALFNEFYHAEVIQKGGKLEYKLLTQPSSIYLAKTSIGFPEAYIKPNFQEILKHY